MDIMIPRPNRQQTSAPQITAKHLASLKSVKVALVDDNFDLELIRK